MLPAQLTRPAFQSTLRPALKPRLLAQKHAIYRLRRDLPVEKSLTGGDPDARTRTNSATQRAIGCVAEAVLALFLVTVVRGW